MISIFQLAAIGLLSFSLGIGYAVMGHSILAAVCMILGVGWAVVDWFGIGSSSKKLKPASSGGPRKFRSVGDPLIDNFALLLFIALSAWGIWLKLPAWLMLIVVLLTLAAWDLGRFSTRLLAITDDAMLKRLEWIHLSRLGIALSGGLLLGGAALLIRISLDFGWALALGMIAVIALNRFVRGLSR